jgi:DNA-binding HxlR family transcriptional regulator
MLILRDIEILGIDRFNRLLDSIQGLTPRVPSMCLTELEKEGFIKHTENRRSAMIASLQQ